MLHSTDKIIKHKAGLLNLAEELGNVSKACQVMGYSRDTFYRYKSAVDEGGVEALLEKTRRKPNRANRVDMVTEEAVRFWGRNVSVPCNLSIANSFEVESVFRYPPRPHFLAHQTAFCV